VNNELKKRANDVENSINIPIIYEDLPVAVGTAPAPSSL